jgi:hypothetical protein
MSEQFIEAMAAADKTRGAWVNFVLDTNVVMEMYSFGDLTRLRHKYADLEALRRSAEFRDRRHRIKHSIVLARWFAKYQIRAASFGNEVIDLLTGKLAPASDPFAFMLTSAILRVIHPFGLRGWSVDPLAFVNHRLTAEDADDEILRAARKYDLAVITWEGFGNGKLKKPDPKCLRDKCHAANVPVFTPEELLAAIGIDVEREAKHFLFSCEKALRTARSQRVLEGDRILDLILPMYRLVLEETVS